LLRFLVLKCRLLDLFSESIPPRLPPQSLMPKASPSTTPKGQVAFLSRPGTIDFRHPNFPIPFYFFLQKSHQVFFHVPGSTGVCTPFFFQGRFASSPPTSLFSPFLFARPDGFPTFGGYPTTPVKHSEPFPLSPPFFE